MRLIVGGAYQGKLDVARSLTGAGSENIVDGEHCTEQELYCAAVVHGLHDYLRRFPAEDPEAFVRNLLEKNPQITVVMNELGCGVVPIDRADRAWREMCGRVSIVLARESSEVYRVICGIAARIK